MPGFTKKKEKLKEKQRDTDHTVMACGCGICLCVCLSYHTTKMREKMVVRMTTENKTRRITRPKLPSSPCLGSGWEEKRSKGEGRFSKTSRVGGAEKGKRKKKNHRELSGERNTHDGGRRCKCVVK